MSAIIYLITNTINHKRYIGLTTKSLSTRWRGHKNSAACGSQTHFHRAIRHHEEHAFSFEILEEVTPETMNEREQYWIDTLSPEYNSTHGGEGALGYTHSEESRTKMRIARNRRPPASAETRAKMSASRRGKPMPEGTGLKHSLRQRGQKRPSPSPVTLAKRSASMKARIAEQKRAGTYIHKGGRLKPMPCA
jgi:group I intron endonuclease